MTVALNRPETTRSDTQTAHPAYAGPLLLATGEAPLWSPAERDRMSRCQSCEWHPATQGHHDRCPENPTHDKETTQ